MVTWSQRFSFTVKRGEESREKRESREERSEGKEKRRREQREEREREERSSERKPLVAGNNCLILPCQSENEGQDLPPDWRKILLLYLAYSDN